ncbi:hypothetical protein [Psychrobacter urativorans]|uniref:Uncharacterized protein n=1 Tax=Psychrobacter urativorans TaxID=45610 RepID=A0A0M4T8N0_9GAMM|nr:hypothetical protein [Psychrobacter urativorans]ALF60259.1 hypothetical protein AOC03_09605 [Psychrobacter urativorans]
MQTKDPALTKTRIVDSNTHPLEHNHDSEHHIVEHDDHIDHDNHKGTETFQETVIGARYVSDDPDHEEHSHAGIHHNHYNVMSTDSDIEGHAPIHKGTETLRETVVGSKYLDDGHNLAHQTDHRDQKGNPFDDNINEHTVSSNAPKSEEINDMNRYATIDNAQRRVLNPDEKD